MPVVPSNLTKALSVDEPGPITSPVPPIPAQLPVVKQTVPVASGKVQVLSIVVKSADVIVPVKDAVATVVCGFRAMLSVLEVEDEKLAEFVVVRVAANEPDVWL